MPRNISKKKRTGKYDCKLYVRARNAELKCKLVTDAHDGCIAKRERDIKKLYNELMHMNQLFVAAIVAAGGMVAIDFNIADKYRAEDIALEHVDEEVFKFTYIGDKAAGQQK